MSRLKPAQGDGQVPAPSRDDLLSALRTVGWPAVTLDGRTVAGEPAWRQLLAEATPDARRAWWVALGALEEETEEETPA